MEVKSGDRKSHLKELLPKGVAANDGLRMVVMGFLEEVRYERKRDIKKGDDEVGGKVGQGPFSFLN